MTLSEYLSLNAIKVSVFATKVGVPPSTISRVLKRERAPGFDLLVKIMEATDGAVTPNDFLPEQEPAPSRPFRPEGCGDESAPEASSVEADGDERAALASEEIASEAAE